MPDVTEGLDFEFYSEDLPTEDLKDELWAEARSRLEELAEGHTDIIGASTAVERVEHRETPQAYRARIVGYVRPNNIVTKEKADKPMAALQQALDALERQVRQKRDKYRERWKKP